LIYLVESSAGEFVLRTSQVPCTQNLDDVRVKPGEGVTGWVAKHQFPRPAPIRASGAFPGWWTDMYEAFSSVLVVYKT
jgi:hypothetical protein